MEDTKTTRLFFKDRWILAYFDIQIDITLAIFWDKLQSYTF